MPSPPAGFGAAWRVIPVMVPHRADARSALIFAPTGMSVVVQSAIVNRSFCDTSMHRLEFCTYVVSRLSDSAVCAFAAPVTVHEPTLTVPSGRLVEI